MVFSIFDISFIIFEHVIYPHQRCEAWLLLLVGLFGRCFEENNSAVCMNALCVICMSMFLR